MKKSFKRKIIIFLVTVVLIVLAVITQRVIFHKIDSENNTNVIASEESKQSEEETKVSNYINVVPTMKDEISVDTVWCGTFQLAWNEMIKNKVKQDIIFNPKETMAENLNKKEFSDKDLSEKDYYTNFGLQTKELKETIEKDIEDKFNEKSDMLDSINWYDTEEQAYGKYISYAMLLKIFTFEYNFIDLDEGEFENGAYQNIKYFGVNNDTDTRIKKQIKILYYNNDEDFAVELTTKEKENIILCNNPKGKNFREIYDNINKNAKSYNGTKSLTNIDDFKIPNLKLDVLREYDELCEKEFKEKDGTIDKFSAAIQTIKLELNKEGGKLKSEAITGVYNTSIRDAKKETPKHLYLDDSFSMFLVEEGKDTPYYASKITDITKFQK